MADGLVGAGVPRAAAEQAAQEIGSGGSRSGDAASQATSAQLDAVHGLRPVHTDDLLRDGGVMAVTFLIALIWLPGDGRGARRGRAGSGGGAGGHLTGGDPGRRGPAREPDA